MSDYISREAALEKVVEVKHRGPELSGYVWHRYIKESDLKDITAADVIPIPKTGIGDASDGFRTFNELYHHRAILFSVICNLMREKAWKSKRHDTGDMYDGMFIVGIETPDGQATYHYDINPYWDMFDVKEVEYAPKWDGHTPDDAIKRIGSLSAADVAPVRHGEWIERALRPTCSLCGFSGSLIDAPISPFKYCPNCGAKMDGEAETQQPHGIDAFLDECPICSNKNSELCDECRCEKRGAFLPENKLSKRSAADAAEHKTIRERFEAAFPRCRIDEYGEPAEICPASLAGKECPATDKPTCMNCPAWDWPAE